jgi:ATP-dependent DNA helicase DinG
LSNDPNNKLESPVELLTEIIKLKSGGETRKQQVTAVEEIGKTIADQTNLLIEAPTGSGKTISYLIPVIFHGSKAVISTATKQLSEQITEIDIPFLQNAIKKVAPEKKFSAALLKGRDNYYCLAKADEQAKLGKQADALFEIEDFGGGSKSKTSAKAKEMGAEMKRLEIWADSTKTGDRSEAPAVSDPVWRQYSSSTSECPGKQVCPFGEACFAEYARDKARKADVVITNHAVVAHDLQAEESTMLGERDLFIFDELHELDSYLSSAWGTRLTAKMIKDAHKVFKTLPDLKEEYLSEIETLGKKFNGVCETIDEGVIEGTPPLLGTLASRLYAVSSKIIMQAQKIAKDESEREGSRKVASVVVRKATEIMDSSQLILDDSPNTVRWVTENDEEKAINAAPLRVGPQLQQALESRDAHMVGTSATIRVNGDFAIPVHNLDLKSTSTEYSTIALDSPFDYRKQAIMYIPHQNNFPAPIGADRKEHTEAVKKEVADLVEASDGRALCLYTTSFAARENGEYLRKKFPKMNILIQGEAPAPQLIDAFKKDERSILVATMGMWHGLDIQGPACSLVIMDKIPFKPMKDPLSVARQKWAEENGRNGFMDVYVAEANVMLAQGAGRLVRSMSDKGVVAILDTRLSSKPYGRSMLKSLPPMVVFQDKAKVISALKRLADTLNKK